MGAEPDKAAFRRGRIITPGTSRQLGVFGLFPPPPAQQRVLTTPTGPLTASSAEPELLWTSFAQLCGGPEVPDYRTLAAGYSTWVVDGVPSRAAGGGVPAASGAVRAAEVAAWQHFCEVVDVLYDADITLFLVGPGPLDWAAAAAALPGLPAELARAADRLALLERVESDEALAAEHSSGS
ncbi:AFG1/ZapE family ATPase [uncultured Arthrobacter sp.]|uniref:AFG1/ZapE family ATPase n=1 Tax=uncultured Arthrobacter sp. TaxID=114050 RepID=UPI003216BA0A